MLKRSAQALLFYLNTAGETMKFAVLSSKAPVECTNKLEELGYMVLSLPPFTRLSPPTDTHADMLFFSRDNIMIMHREYYEAAHDIIDVLCRECHIGILLCDQNIKPAYPYDIAYNAMCIDGTIYSRSEHTSPLILKLAKNKGMKIQDVAQGYAACSTLDLGGGHVICADPSLSHVYEKHNIKVTRITNGSVKLPPYDYGFIGGCSGVDGDTVFFCGDIELHSDKDMIKKAIKSRSMTWISLCSGELFDIGGIKFFNTVK